MEEAAIIKCITEMILSEDININNFRSLIDMFNVKRVELSSDDASLYKKMCVYELVNAYGFADALLKLQEIINTLNSKHVELDRVRGSKLFLLNFGLRKLYKDIECYYKCDVIIKLYNYLIRNGNCDKSIITKSALKPSFNPDMIFGSINDKDSIQEGLFSDDNNTLDILRNIEMSRSSIYDETIKRIKSEFSKREVSRLFNRFISLFQDERGTLDIFRKTALSVNYDIITYRQVVSRDVEDINDEDQMSMYKSDKRKAYTS